MAIFMPMAIFMQICTHLKHLKSNHFKMEDLRQLVLHFLKIVLLNEKLRKYQFYHKSLKNRNH